MNYSCAGEWAWVGRYAKFGRPMMTLNAALFAVLAVAVGACGEGGQARPEDELRQAATKAVNSVYTGDVETAYESFAAACRKQVSYPDFANTVAAVRSNLESALKISFADVRVSGVDITHFTGARGDTVIHTGLINDASVSLNNSQEVSTWVFEDGKWADASCEDMSLHSAS